ncbi:uncharacterized protein A4U43_C05F15440 [Asparagus officinalis]|uniref:Uncharacterized protein n=1 Tax=Asparagus officinalis TaxID=4686 RepID=A0A5P1ERT9_ASPOF|nr:uncharacterized protein A4U43_C05F15440 [Asparagus officinalis]
MNRHPRPARNPNVRALVSVGPSGEPPDIRLKLDLIQHRPQILVVEPRQLCPVSSPRGQQSLASSSTSALLPQPPCLQDITFRGTHLAAAVVVSCGRPWQQWHPGELLGMKVACNARATPNVSWDGRVG